MCVKVKHWKISISIQFQKDRSNSYLSANIGFGYYIASNIHQVILNKDVCPFRILDWKKQLFLKDVNFDINFTKSSNLIRKCTRMYQYFLNCTINLEFIPYTTKGQIVSKWYNYNLSGNPAPVTVTQ